MARTLRWGVLGTGNIARQFMVGIAASTRNRVVAVGSRRTATASRFSTDHAVPTAHTGYARLVTDPQVDAVYVALPNALHHPWTLAALRAGKHVLCEKPMGASRAEAEEMFDTATREGRVLTEAFMFRSHPLLHRIQRRVADGAIGKLTAVRTSFCFVTRKVRGNIRFSAALAGGALMDVGCYCIGFSRFFAGAEPNQVTATARLHRGGVDVYTAATLRFPNGVVASFACGMDAQADNTALISGNEGYIQIPVPWKPGQVRNPYIMGRMATPLQDGARGRRGPQQRAYHVSARRPLVTLMTDDFARAVFDGAPPVVDRRDALGNMQVLDDLRRAVGVAIPATRTAPRRRRKTGG